MDKSESTSAGRNRRRRPRRGSRSASSSSDANFRVLSQQLSRLNKTLAAGRPTINHPTFVGSERWNLDTRSHLLPYSHQKYTAGLIMVKGCHYLIQSRNMIRNLFRAFKFELTLCRNLILPCGLQCVKFLPPQTYPLPASLLCLRTEPHRYWFINMLHLESKLTTNLRMIFRRCALIYATLQSTPSSVYSKDDALDTDELVLHVDVEHQRIPTSGVLPV
uniref:Capsid protein n=1 Tax=Cucumber mosaic virus TaxID=12305 RepID=A2A1X2_9BROM|nr:capsid protein [Cucumber mosaic virus]